MPSSPSPTSPPARAPATSAGAASTPRRRRRLLPSSAGGGSSFSSSSSSSFSFFPPTSPSPFHRFLPSPLRASSVPFSWEHRPGIPKTPARSRSSSKQQAGGGGKSATRPLPLPPSLLSRASSDLYASAVVPAEYAAAMPPPGYMRKARRVSRGSGSGGRLRRRPRLAVDALAGWLSVLSLYRSCKRAADCFAAKAKSKPPPAP